MQKVVAAQRSQTHLFEADALDGIEVDAQLVGVVRVRRTIRPQVQSETSDVHGPQNVGDVGDDEHVDSVPFGVETVVDSSHGGAPAGMRFW